MSPQHLSDEAVAAFADGVLSGHARDRAARHVDACQECRQAVRIQREAAYALRAADAPSLPQELLDKLRTVPLTTPLPAPPTTVDRDGTPMFSTMAPMSALVPERREPNRRTRPSLSSLFRGPRR
jgi:anti-sigma factor ChrR (cupin superfamily)